MGDDDGKNRDDKVDQGGGEKKKERNLYHKMFDMMILIKVVLLEKKRKTTKCWLWWCKFSGDENCEASVAETNKIEPNQPDFIISGIILGVKEKNIIDDDEGN